MSVDYNMRSLDVMRGASGVYTITFKGIDGYYVGATERLFRQRWQDHMSLLRHGKHHSKKLQDAFDSIERCEKKVCFDILVLSEYDTITSDEQFWLNTLNGAIDGFNMHGSAYNSKGTKRTQAQRDANRSSGNWKKANEARRGMKHTEEAKAKIRDARARQVMKPYTVERSKKQSELFKSMYSSGEMKPSCGNRKYRNIILEKDGIKLEFANTTKAADFLNSRHGNISAAIKHKRTEPFKGYKIYLKDE